MTTPEVSAIRDADRIIGLLEANEIHKIDLIEAASDGPLPHHPSFWIISGF